VTDINLDVDVDVDDDAPLFRRRVAVVVAGVAFVGSLVGLLHAQRSNEENAAARNAALHAIERVASTAEVDTSLFGDEAMVIASTELQALRVLSDSRALTAVPGSDDETLAEAASERFGTLADVARDQAEAENLTQDLQRIQGRQVDAFTAEFRQELASDAAGEHGAIADASVAVLAVLAVSLFLLGLSLTVAGTARLILAGPGVAIAVAATAWGALLALDRVDTVPDELVQTTGEARAFIGSGEYDEAIDLLDGVIDQAPDYSRALATRAFARTLQVAGEPTDPGANLHYVDDDDLDDALDDARAAQAGSLDDDLTALAILGFLHLNDGDGEAAIATFETLLARNDRDAFTRYALAASRLVAGDADGAEEDYAAAADLLRALFDADQVNVANALVAAAYSDGERALAAHPEVEETVFDARRDLVQAIARTFGITEDLGSGDGIELDGELAVTSFGARFDVSGTLSGADPDTQVTAVWLHQRPDQTDAPFGVPAGSTRLPMTSSFPLGDEEGFFFQSATSPLGSEGRCPVPGVYRVDVYADLTFVGSAEIDVPLTALGELVFSDNEVPDIGLCRPPDWDVQQGENEVVFDDTSSADRIEVRAFASTEDQREGDRDDVVADVLLDTFDELGFDPTGNVLPGFPLFGTSDDGRNVCVRASALSGIDPRSGQGRVELLALGPDGVFRAIAFEVEDPERVFDLGIEISETVQLRAVGVVAAGEEFSSCNP
jgi:tetratricopeptide (TPR) repeat protein